MAHGKLYEAKWNMIYPSDIARPRFGPGSFRFMANHTTYLMLVSDNGGALLMNGGYAINGVVLSWLNCVSLIDDVCMVNETSNGRTILFWWMVLALSDSDCKLMSLKQWLPFLQWTL